jgi:hypothetical protein
VWVGHSVRPACSKYAAELFFHGLGPKTNTKIKSVGHVQVQFVETWKVPVWALLVWVGHSCPTPLTLIFIHCTTRLSVMGEHLACDTPWQVGQERPTHTG